MSHMIDPRVLKGFDEANLVKLVDILREMREGLEEGNAFEYWEKIEVTTDPVANTEFLVKLSNLNRTPSFYIMIKKDKAVDVYTGTTAWSKDKLYLKATVASATITLLVVG